MKTVGVAIVGAGKIALANHVVGLRTHPLARVVAVCDADPAVAEHASRDLGVPGYTDYREILKRSDVDALVVATPNFAHEPIVLAACAAAKHVMCEKPLALDYPGAVRMLHAARAAHVRNMTAFTYRFVPAMRYFSHLINQGALGQPLHFRARRFQDWGDRPLGWRQKLALAGSGELGDMLSHRVDYGHFLIGPIDRLVADMRRFVDLRGGQPSDVDDWVGMLCQFRNSQHTTGVLESTKLAAGRGEGLRGEDVVEINGTLGSIVYSTQKPLEIWIGNAGAPEVTRREVPREWWVWPGSTRKPGDGDPLVTFRYDQSFEFVQAIVEQRDCFSSFADGAAVQRVMQAIAVSTKETRWVSPHEIHP